MHEEHFSQLETKCLSLGGFWKEELIYKRGKVYSVYVCEFNTKRIKDAKEKWIEYGKYLLSVRHILGEDKAISRLIDITGSIEKDMAIIVTKDSVNVDAVAEKYEKSVKEIIKPEKGMAMYKLSKGKILYFVSENVVPATPESLEKTIDDVEKAIVEYFSKYKPEKIEKPEVILRSQ